MQITKNLDLRTQFPILEQTVHGRRLVYLDNAATTQLPRSIIDVFVQHYTQNHANIHRGIHTLAEKSTENYEGAREKVAKFIGATSEEIVFTHGTTESDNLLAFSILPTLPEGSEIVVTEMDHHSNFVMWQQLAKKHHLIFKVIPITPDFKLDMEEAQNLISSNTKIVAVPHVSNVLGTINPINELAALAHNHGALLFVDGAQAVAHVPVNVKALGADAYTFSGHKMYAPTGIGVLYCKKELLHRMQPFMYGGGMIEEVTIEHTRFAPVPEKFEAGTPNIAGAICLGAAVDFLQGIGMQNIQAHEQELTRYAMSELEKCNLAIIGPRDNRVGVLSFIVNGVHAHDVCAALDAHGVAVRGGHHCAQPLARRLGITATTRASIGIYTTNDDIDELVAAVKHCQEVFHG